MSDKIDIYNKYFNNYKKHHKNNYNILVHVLCIPSIAWSTFGIVNLSSSLGHRPFRQGLALADLVNVAAFEGAVKTNLLCLRQCLRSFCRIFFRVIFR